MNEMTIFATNHPVLSVLWLTLLFLLLYSFIGVRFRAYKPASPSVAIQLMNHEEAVVIDVREDNEYAKGHIVGSIHMPMSYFDDRLKDIEKYKSKPIIVGCQSGQRSGQACSKLTKAGFETVYNLSGGIMNWQHENMPITKK